MGKIAIVTLLVVGVGFVASWSQHLDLLCNDLTEKDRETLNDRGGPKQNWCKCVADITADSKLNARGKNLLIKFCGSVLSTRLEDDNIARDWNECIDWETCTLNRRFESPQTNYTVKGNIVEINHTQTWDHFFFRPTNNKNNRSSSSSNLTIIDNDVLITKPLFPESFMNFTPRAKSTNGSSHSVLIHLYWCIALIFVFLVVIGLGGYYVQLLIKRGTLLPRTSSTTKEEILAKI